jgi:hypothetical protein
MTATAERAAARAHLRTRNTEAHDANVRRVIAELEQVRGLGHIDRFTHRVEPHKDRPEWTVDWFDVTFAGGRRDELTFASVRLYLRGFFAGRSFPRATLAPPHRGG